MDDQLRLVHVQAKGTHNSYHIEPAVTADDSHRYTQPSLTDQLALHGVRQFELDLHSHKRRGFQIFHIPGLDPESTCLAFADCLSELKAWSDLNRWHLPLLVWIEPKDETAVLDSNLELLTGRWPEVEEAVLAVWPRDRIFAPDDLRGAHADLPTAIAADGWATLGRLRGKIIFALLDSGDHRTEYTAPAANLAGRLFFIDPVDSSDPGAALFKINNAAANAAQVSDLVARGFVVTSNVDGPAETDTDNTARLTASLAAGINFGSSDFPAPVAGRNYWFDLPGGTPARCNPVANLAGCTAEEVEQLAP